MGSSGSVLWLIHLRTMHDKFTVSQGSCLGQYITVQCRSALLSHAWPTMFYIPLVILYFVNCLSREDWTLTVVCSWSGGRGKRRGGEDDVEGGGRELGYCVCIISILIVTKKLLTHTAHTHTPHTPHTHTCTNKNNTCTFTHTHNTQHTQHTYTTLIIHTTPTTHIPHKCTTHNTPHTGLNTQTLSCQVEWKNSFSDLASF